MIYRILTLILVLCSFSSLAQKPQDFDRALESNGEPIFIIGDNVGYNEFRIDTSYCDSIDLLVKYENIKSLSTFLLRLPNACKGSGSSGETIYSADQIDSIILTRYPDLDTISTDDFDGNWSSLIGIPSDIADGDDDTIYNDTELRDSLAEHRIDINTNQQAIIDSSVSVLNQANTYSDLNDDNTQLDSTEIASFGYVAGPHYDDSDVLDSLSSHRTDINQNSSNINNLENGTLWRLENTGVITTDFTKGYGQVGIGSAQGFLDGTSLFIDPQGSGGGFGALHIKLLEPSDIGTNRTAIGLNSQWELVSDIYRNTSNNIGFYNSNLIGEIYGGYPFIIEDNGRVSINTLLNFEPLNVGGGIWLGTAVGSENGTIQYSGTDIEGRVGGSWLSLTDKNDSDADPTNEYNTGSSLNGTAVEITDGGGTESIELNGTFATDAELTASEAADLDQDSTNEYNTSIDFVNNTIFITDGGGTLQKDLSSLIPEMCNEAIIDVTKLRYKIAEEVDSFQTKYLDSIEFESGVVNASNALGPPDGNPAELFDITDTVIFTLTTHIKEGEELYLTGRRDPATPLDPTVKIEESCDGVYWYESKDSPLIVSGTSYEIDTIVATSTFKYLRLTTNTIYNYELDAIEYRIPKIDNITIANIPIQDNSIDSTQIKTGGVSYDNFSQNIKDIINNSGDTTNIYNSDGELTERRRIDVSNGELFITGNFPGFYLEDTSQVDLDNRVWRILSEGTFIGIKPMTEFESYGTGSVSTYPYSYSYNNDNRVTTINGGLQFTSSPTVATSGLMRFHNNTTFQGYTGGNWVDLNNIFSRDSIDAYYTGGNVGIGTSTPNVIGQHTIGGTHRSLVLSHTDQARFGIVGTQARMGLYDIDAPLDEKFMRLRFADGIMSFSSLVDDGTAFVNENILTLENSSGNVGIGTNTPQAKLQITGSSQIEFAINATSGNPDFSFMDNDTVKAQIKYNPSLKSMIFSVDASNKTSGISGDNSIMTLRGDSLGYYGVGIGTSNPTYILDVRDNSTVVEEGIFQMANSTGRTLQILQPDPSNSDDPWTFLTGNSYQFRVDAVDALKINHDGNVGIGTTSPTQALDVVGTVEADAFTINGVPVGTSTDSYWSQSGSDINYITGKVGIGTSSPSAKLHIEENNTTNASLKVGGFAVQSYSSGNVIISNENTYYDLDSAGLVRTSTLGSSWMQLVNRNIFFRNTDIGPVDSTYQSNTIMTLTPEGVGIGTTLPSSKLHIKENDNNTLAHQILLQNEGSGVHTSALAFQVSSSAETVGLAPKAAIAYERGKSNGRGKMHFYNDSVDDANAYSAGDIKMTIDNDGLVGIGTSSPTATLHVHKNGANGVIHKKVDIDGGNMNSTVSGSGVYTRYSSISNSYGAFGGYTNSSGNEGAAIWDETISGEPELFLQNGNVGIGTVSPEWDLTVAGSGVKIFQVESDDGGPVQYRFKTDNSNARFLAVDNSNNQKSQIQFSAPGRIDFLGVVATDTLMVLDSGSVYVPWGNVGIGTSSPSAILDLEATATLIEINNTSDNQIWQTGSSGSSSFLIYDATNAKLPFLVQANTPSDAFFLQGTTGNLGIGTSSPNAKLDIYSAVSSDQLRISNSPTLPYKIGRNGATGFLDFRGSQSGFTGYEFKSDDNSSLMTLIDNGNVGIGTDIPSEKLDVNGNIRVRNIASGAFSSAVNQTADGTFTTSTSDRRLKRNIENLDSTALDKVLALQGVTYKWKPETEKVERIKNLKEERIALRDSLIAQYQSDSIAIKNKSFKKIIVLDSSYVSKTGSGSSIGAPDSLVVTERIITAKQQRDEYRAEMQEKQKEKKQAYRDKIKEVNESIKHEKVVTDAYKETRIGVIAQDVREVAPELVFENQDGYLGVRYNEMIPLLIEGMKEQQKMIDALKKSNEDLIKRIESLENK